MRKLVNGLAEVIQKLNIEIQDILNWFKINGLVATPGKFQVKFLGRFDPISTFGIGNISVKVKNQVKLLGIYIDDKLRFNFFIFCQKFTNDSTMFQADRLFPILRFIRRIYPHFLDNRLKPLARQVKSFVKHTNDFLLKHTSLE